MLQPKNLKIMNRARLVQITREEKIAEAEFNPLINFIYEQIWQNLFPPQILTDDLTTRVANNIITPPDAPIPDCQTCGACCVALPCVGVRPDEEIAAADYWDITAEGASGEIIIDRFMRRDGETYACAGLAGNVGESVTCRLYERRPKICRYFEAGSDKCHALRRAYGLEPFLSLMEMFEALQKLKSQPAKSNPAEAIAEVKFVEQTETGNVKIAARLKDGAVKTLHLFNPQTETWRRFEFDGLTVAQANELIAGRRESGQHDVDDD